MKRPTAEQLSKVIVIVLLLGMTVSLALALVLLTAVSPETISVLLGALALLAFVTFVMTAMFRKIEHFLETVPKYPWFQAPNFPPSRSTDHLMLLTGKALVGVSFQLVAYWFYMAILAIFFFVLGEPFTSAPSYLLWATFSGTVIVRLSRYIPNWAQRVATLIADFLVPFGVIAALALWIKFGGSFTSPQILEILAVYGPLIFMLFPLYLLTDATFQLLTDRGLLRPGLS